MSVTTIDFTTGPATLPDVGELSYNGCTFGPLFETSVSGNCVKDEAGRTVKYMEYTITVDGYVTLPDGADTVGGVMDTLRTLLTQQGGSLVYVGRGCDITVGPKGDINSRDVAWGPAPELIEFQPLGAGRSAKVKWVVKTRFSELLARTPAPFSKPGRGGLSAIPMLQFNYQTVVSYGEDGFCTLSNQGVLEIPLTRTPDQKTRTLQATADNLRDEIENRILSGIDLSRFRITRREFPLSSDKRTLTWSIQADEKPYMDLPPECTIARGSFSFKPAKAGMGLCTWLCTLRCTYTVRKDRPRRIAWLAFLALLRERMRQGRGKPIPKVKGGNQSGGRIAADIARGIINRVVAPGAAVGLNILSGYLKQQTPKIPEADAVMLIDLSGEEGVYLDSKTMSFSATWRLVSPFSRILLSSGLWRKVSETDARGNNYWATSIQAVMGVNSWTTNRADPKLDVIVDFGS